MAPGLLPHKYSGEVILSQYRNWGYCKIQNRHSGYLAPQLDPPILLMENKFSPYECHLND